MLDPPVFRAADAFLRGAPETGDEALEEAISQNVDALAAFVDAVILQDQLPIFDYAATWELEPEESAATLVELCNQDEELLVGRVDEEAYQQARTPAVEASRALPPVEPELVVEIRSELSAFDYRWRPRLDELGELDETARRIASFRYDGLLFHGYAEAISDRRQPQRRLHQMAGCDSMSRS